MPELTRIKQSLYASQVSSARMVHDALLLGWDPELEHDLQLLMSMTREAREEEEALDEMDCEENQPRSRERAGPSAADEDDEATQIDLDCATGDEGRSIPGSSATSSPASSVASM